MFSLYLMTYINSHIKFLHIRWVLTKRNVFQYIVLNFILPRCRLTCFNWQRSMIKLKTISCSTFHFLVATFLTWRNLMWELYNLFSFFWGFIVKTSKSSRTLSKTLQCQQFQKLSWIKLKSNNITIQNNNSTSSK
jgi:hypothetical protein